MRFSRKRSVIFKLKLKNDELIKNDGIAVISEIKMTEIERILNDSMALWNISDANIKSSFYLKSLMTLPLDLHGGITGIASTEDKARMLQGTL